MIGRTIEAVLWKLRGEQKSIRGRFYKQPKEYLTYFLYRLAGKSWADFYADRLNRDVKKSQARGKTIPKSYLDQAKVHLEYLKNNGLCPDSYFLDYGCGMLRLGIYVIPYLNESRYVGVDIAAERVDIGRQLLAEHGIADDRYETILVRDCLLRELAGRQFDVVWANSVLTHMPLDDISTTFSAMRPLLKTDGHFLFNFSRGRRVKRRGIKDFSYRPKDIQALAEGAGYDCDVMSDWDENQMGSVMARVRVRQ